MEELKRFGEILADLMEENELTSKQLGDAIGVSDSAVRHWRTVSNEIKLNHLVSLADYFKCSIEFLIGRSNSLVEFQPRALPPFPERLRIVMKEKGKTSYRMNLDTKFKNTYFHDWNHGAMPTLSTLVELSDLLDCTVDYLIGRE